MQNHYLEMMTQTQALIARATQISESAEGVATLLRQHKADVAEVQDMVNGRLEAIQKILADDAQNYRERFATILTELDVAIATIEGNEPKAEAPGTPPLEPLPVEAPLLEEVPHAEA